MLSRTTKQHFGIAPETEATSAVLLAAIHPEDRDRVRRAYYQSAELGGEGQLAVEFRVVDATSGEERWLSARARMYFDEEGRPARVIGTTVDVTTRKNLDEQLRQRIEELQTVMDVAPVALVTATDADCSVVVGNGAAYRMLETPAGSNFRSRARESPGHGVFG